MGVTFPNFQTNIADLPHGVSPTTLLKVMVKSHIPGACLVLNFNLSVTRNHLGEGHAKFGLDSRLFEDHWLVLPLFLCSQFFLLILFRQSPCGRWPSDPHFENVITASVQSNGEILINNVGYCLTIHTGNKLRALSNSHSACRQSRSRFRIVG